MHHGKRADSIVKNMLLHSRQDSGEHRSVDLNALVEESLNLAYHGARAEKGDFKITLERSFDPTASEVDVFPQEITRALLNLISNSFYATTQRKAEANGGSYEPILTAATKNLGDSVEIRIRDNGTGIPPEVREKIFNPFFTTKPAGEGTGLGLSISHDIIVKQHGGSIDVDTKPGEFTEFSIILPRGVFLSGPRVSARATMSAFGGGSAAGPSHSRPARRTEFGHLRERAFAKLTFNLFRTRAFEISRCGLDENFRRPGPRRQDSPKPNAEHWCVKYDFERDTNKFCGFRLVQVPRQF